MTQYIMTNAIYFNGQLNSKFSADTMLGNNLALLTYLQQPIRSLEEITSQSVHLLEITSQSYLLIVITSQSDHLLEITGVV